MKNDSQLLTTGEFVRLSDITKNTLVWYEKYGLIRPLEVGENTYHYYKPEQYFDVDLIQNLKYFGLSLNQCGQYFTDKSEGNYYLMMLQQEQYLERQVNSLLRQKGCVDMTLNDYLISKSHNCDNPRIIRMPEMHYLRARFSDPDSAFDYVKTFRKIYNKYHEIEELYELSCSMLNATVVTAEEVSLGNDYNRSYAAVWINKRIPDEFCFTFVGGECAVSYHKGERDNVGNTYENMLRFIADNDMRISGDALERDVINHCAASAESEYVREIMIPVEPA